MPMIRHLTSLLTFAALCLGACGSGKKSSDKGTSSGPGVSKMASKVPSVVRQRAALGGTVRVIVRLSGRDELNKKLDVEQNVKALSQRLAGEAVQAFRPLGKQPLVALTTNDKGLDALERASEVQGVVLDTAARAMATRTMNRIRAEEVWREGVEGTGPSVAILDTGIDAAHPYFAGRIVKQACFSVTDGTHTSLCHDGKTMDDSANAAVPTPISIADHGTHVAGIAAGFNGFYQDCRLDGVARQTKIVAVQVFTKTNDPFDCGAENPCLATYRSDQIRALQYLLDHRADLKLAAVNLSFAEKSLHNVACDEDERKELIDELLEAGVATVIAAGNEVTSLKVSRPGCITSAVTVGGLSPEDAPVFSTGALVDLFAPGACVASAVSNGAYAEAKGTSVAAPLVSGAIALLRSSNSSVSMPSIISALLDGSSTVTDCWTGETRRALNVHGSWQRLTAPIPARNASPGVVQVLPPPPSAGSAGELTAPINDCTLPESATCPSVCDPAAIKSPSEPPATVTQSETY